MTITVEENGVFFWPLWQGYADGYNLFTTSLVELGETVTNKIDHSFNSFRAAKVIP